MEHRALHTMRKLFNLDLYPQLNPLYHSRLEKVESGCEVDQE